MANQRFSDIVERYNLKAASPIIDICVNLTKREFTPENVLRRAMTVNVVKCVVSGSDLSDSKDGLRLVTLFPQRLICGIGVHPHRAQYPYGRHHNPKNKNKLTYT